MAKSKKSKSLKTRAKQMKRAARLMSAKTWIPSYTGKKLLRGYCKHYGIQWRVAALELKLLGHEIDPEYLAARDLAEKLLAKQRRAKKARRMELRNEHWHPFTDAYSAYLAEDYAAMHDLEMRERYGDDWMNYVMNDLEIYTDEIEDRSDNANKSPENENETPDELEDLTFFETDDDDEDLPF
jgi:hypothetical protein